jgi:hypothetical protein
MAITGIRDGLATLARKRFSLSSFVARFADQINGRISLAVCIHNARDGLANKARL